MKKIILFLILGILSLYTAIACVTPTANSTPSGDVVYCSGNYNNIETIMPTSNTKISFNNTNIKGLGKGNGNIFYINSRHNVTIDCGDIVSNSISEGGYDFLISDSYNVYINNCYSYNITQSYVLADYSGTLDNIYLTNDKVRDSDSVIVMPFNNGGGLNVYIKDFDMAENDFTNGYDLSGVYRFRPNYLVLDNLTARLVMLGSVYEGRFRGEVKNSNIDTIKVDRVESSGVYANITNNNVRAISLQGGCIFGDWFNGVYVYNNNVENIYDWLGNGDPMNSCGNITYCVGGVGNNNDVNFVGNNPQRGVCSPNSDDVSSKWNFTDPLMGGQCYLGFIDNYGDCSGTSWDGGGRLSNENAGFIPLELNKTYEVNFTYYLSTTSVITIGSRMIRLMNQDNTKQRRLSIHVSNTELGFDLGTFDFSATTYCPYALTNNTYYDISVVFDSDGTDTLYVDGTQVCSASEDLRYAYFEPYQLWVQTIGSGYSDNILDVEVNAVTDPFTYTPPPVCTESWESQYTACDVTDLQTKYYTDTNLCGTFINLPIDNATTSACNYCTLSSSVHSTGCVGNITTTYYTNDNYESCCALTGFSADCNLPSNTTASCGIGNHITGDIAGVVVDIGVETGMEVIKYIGLIALVGLGVWLMAVL